MKNRIFFVDFEFLTPMKAFDLHHSIVEDYKAYLQSFTNIKDERVKVEVDKAFQQGIFLPEPLIQFNPSFEAGESIEQLINEGIFHPDVKKIFGSFNLYKHQVEAIKKGSKGGKFRCYFRHRLREIAYLSCVNLQSHSKG